MIESEKIGCCFYVEIDSRRVTAIMNYLLAIPYVNRPDLLEKAVRSVQYFWPHTTIIDNSDAGLDPSAWPVQLVRPSVPLTFSQTMNLVQRMATDQSCDFYFFMHNDAEAGEGTPERLLAVVEQAVTSGQRLGVAFTAYDTLAAMNMTMVREVGRWDTNLPQYYADNDYYRRVRLAGYEMLYTDLEVTHHNGASSTIKSDPRLGYINGVTHPLYSQYYSAKWGGDSGAETYDWPFDGAPLISFVHYLRGQELYGQLAGSYETVEGTLLERADDPTTASQIEAVRYAVEMTRPRRVLETGTCKSFFGYVLSQMVHGVELYTFDHDPSCLTGVNLLNAAQNNVNSVFTLGDSKQTLSLFTRDGIGLALIDGGLDESTVLSDIENAMRLGITLILCDDTRTMPEVSKAVDCALHNHKTYERISNPYYRHDARGIAYLLRKE